VFVLAVALAVGGQRWITPGPYGAAFKLMALAALIVACAALGLWREQGAVAETTHRA